MTIISFANLREAPGYLLYDKEKKFSLVNLFLSIIVVAKQSHNIITKDVEVVGTILLGLTLLILDNDDFNITSFD